MWGMGNKGKAGINVLKSLSGKEAGNIYKQVAWPHIHCAYSENTLLLMICSDSRSPRGSTWPRGTPGEVVLCDLMWQEKLYLLLLPRVQEDQVSKKGTKDRRNS